MPNERPPDPTNSVDDADGRLETWERWITPVLVIAALLPFAGVLSDDPDDGVGPAIELLCWAVFLADLVVQLVWRRGYLSTSGGRIDLAIVLLSFPWFILVEPDYGLELLALSRLARIARIAWLAASRTHGLRLLFERVGKLTAYVLATCVVCAVVVRNTEPPTSGFDTFGDAFWWAIVTTTTVGYGDLTPVTGTGRVMAVVLMVLGLALLGTLAAALADFLGVQRDNSDDA